MAEAVAAAGWPAVGALFAGWRSLQVPGLDAAGSISGCGSASPIVSEGALPKRAEGFIPTVFTSVASVFVPARLPSPSGVEFRKSHSGTGFASVSFHPAASLAIVTKRSTMR